MTPEEELDAAKKTMAAWNKASERHAETLLARERLLCALYLNRRGAKNELQRLVLDDNPHTGIGCVLRTMMKEK